MTFPTLTEYFESHFMPYWVKLKNLDPKTERSYRESLKLWVKQTPNKPIDQITKADIAEFCIGMKDYPGKKKGTTMCASSRQKHFRQLDTILKTTGPQTKHNQDGQGLLSVEPPFFPKVKVPKTRTHAVWTIDELHAMYRAAGKMIKPVVEGYSAVDFWRALLVLDFYTGLRITELINVRYSNIHNRVVQANPEVGKNKKTDPHWLPLDVIEHIERIKTSDRDIILYVPKYHRQRRTLYDDFHLLQKLASLPESRQWGFHSIRKSHGTEVKRYKAPHQRNLTLAQRSLGHSDSSITLGHYISGAMEDQEMVAVIEELPSPVPPEFRLL